MKDQAYYLKKYNDAYEECLKEAKDNGATDVAMGADDIFAETADAESLVGYYLYWYKDEALEMWTENVTRKYTNNNDEIMKIILATTKMLNKLQGSDATDLEQVPND